MWGGGGGWEICDECSWTPRPGGELPMVGLKGPKVGAVGGGGVRLAHGVSSRASVSLRGGAERGPVGSMAIWIRL